MLEGLPIIGSYISGRMAAANAAEQHDWSVEDASVNRAFQERMANTAHQREVKDLRDAGLNPILSGTGGAGANTPSGAMADSNVADVPDYAAAANSALNAKLLKTQEALQKAQAEQLSSASEANRAQAAKTRKEAAILSPKATLFEKISEAINSGASNWKNFKGYEKKNQEKYKQGPEVPGGY